MRQLFDIVELWQDFCAPARTDDAEPTMHPNDRTSRSVMDCGSPLPLLPNLCPSLIFGLLLQILEHIATDKNSAFSLSTHPRNLVFP